jgi:hypothetical protein
MPVTVTLRTPSGWEIAIAAESTETVGDLKSKMHVANDAWRPETQRFVLNGAVLSDDSASLASVGLKDGATIYVVKKLSSLSEATAEVEMRKAKSAAAAARKGPPPAAARRTSASGASSRGSRMQVRCPADAGPGSMLTIQVPGRGNMRVTVPATVGPGAMFEIVVPHPVPNPVPTSTTSFQFTVPASARPGQTIHVTVPGHGPVAVTIPAAATPGQILQIRV